MPASAPPSRDGAGAIPRWLPWLLVLPVTLWFWTLAVSRWNAGLVTNYDLGIFSQSARSYASGHLPVSHIRELPLLGDHFSPLNALLGPAWLIWPDPRMLILVQSACIGLAVTMLVLWTYRTVGLRWAGMILLAALLGRGIITSAMFDFHEVAWAAPMTVALCWAILRGRFGIILAMCLGLTLVKEDLGMTIVGAAAAMVLHRGRGGRRHSWRQVAAVGALGVLALVVSSAAIAHFNPTGQSPYVDLILRRGHPADEGTGPLTARLAPVGLLVLSAGIIGLRCPAILVALPTIAWRVVSSKPSYWSLDFHYDLVPTFAALSCFVATLPWLRSRANRLLAALSVLALVTTAVLGVVHLTHRLPWLMSRTPPADRVANIQTLLAEVPDDARLAAMNSTGAYAVADHDVYTLAVTHKPTVRYALFTMDDAWKAQLPLCMRQALADQATHPQWTVTRAGDVVLVDFRKDTDLGTLLPTLCAT